LPTSDAFQHHNGLFGLFTFVAEFGQHFVDVRFESLARTSSIETGRLAKFTQFYVGDRIVGVMQRRFAAMALGMATQLNFRAAPEAAHVVSVGKVKSWLEGGAKSPNEQVEKNRLRELLLP
jgi:hypothetical protein